MKICYVASVRIPSEKAAGLAIIRQCNAFAKLGHEVILLVPHRHSSVSRDVADYYQEKVLFTIKFYRSFDLFRFGIIGFIFTRIWDMLYTTFILLFRVGKVDVLYVRDQWMLALPLLFKNFKISILELHTKHQNRVTKFVTSRADYVIVISQGLKEFYSNLVSRNDLQLLPSGVDLHQFKQVNDSVDEMRARLGLPADKCVLSYVGKYKSMGEEKGVSEIIKSFAWASEKNEKLFLQIVGAEKDEISELQELAGGLGIKPDSYIFRELEQPLFARYLFASDVLLMNYPDTEHYANYMSPTKLFAYMAVKKPIITSDLPSIRSIELAGVKFVKPGDSRGFSDAIIEVTSNYDTYLSNAKENLELVEKYTWDNRVDRICTNFTEYVN